MKPEKEPRKTIWLHLPDYAVLPLKPGLAEHVVGLKRALQEGIPVYPDSARQNFFAVELENGWMYIHVFAEARTVYLVAQFVAESTSEPGFTRPSHTLHI